MPCVALRCAYYSTLLCLASPCLVPGLTDVPAAAELTSLKRPVDSTARKIDRGERESERKRPKRSIQLQAGISISPPLLPQLQVFYLRSCSRVAAPSCGTFARHTESPILLFDSFRPPLSSRLSRVPHHADFLGWSFDGLILSTPVDAYNASITLSPGHTDWCLPTTLTSLSSKVFTSVECFFLFHSCTVTEATVNCLVYSTLVHWKSIGLILPLPSVTDLLESE